MPKTPPYELSASDVNILEEGYAGNQTPHARVVSRIFGHLRFIENELLAAKADPARYAKEPGIIQPDLKNEGKFVFKTTAEAEAMLKAEREKDANRKAARGARAPLVDSREGGGSPDGRHQ